MLQAVKENTYLNPVYRQDFPDPFILKFKNEYWAICTGIWHDGGAFGVLHSRDLINWFDRGSAIKPLPIPAAPCYWAPEITYDNGKFYLYYSVGNEENMEIRVAVSDVPDSGYADSGHRLTQEQFAIDAHVFVDADGTRWFFYATDFLEHSHIGTGTVCDRMISPFKLEGEPRPVTRAAYDWQVYDPQRASKGNVRWHTIEGSFILKHKNSYYQMFSGGNWQNISYGVSYAVTKNINVREEWKQTADGEQIFPILRTIPEKVVGPGHNSVVRGTDNRELYCIYHRWANDLSARQMAIDPLDFVGERMFIRGPSFEPQPTPNPATFQDFFDSPVANGLGSDWQHRNDEQWSVENGVAFSNSLSEIGEGVCPIKSNYFLVEISSKLVDAKADDAGYGFCLKSDEADLLRCLVLPRTKQIEISEQNQHARQIFELPKDFIPEAFHLWRVEVNNKVVRIQLDEAAFRLEKQLESTPEQFALTAQTAGAAFAGFALTIGFEDLFDNEKNDLKALGWTSEDSSQDSWQVQENYLQCNSPESDSIILKTLALTDFELVVNSCLKRRATPQGSYGFILRRTTNSEIRLIIEKHDLNSFLRIIGLKEATQFKLPADFNLLEFQQFRFRSKNNRFEIFLENVNLGEIEIENNNFEQIGLFVRKSNAVFDMVRVTALR